MVGIPNQPPIYMLDLPAQAWRLFWWLIYKMDENQELNYPWQKEASKELGIYKDWISHCAEVLNEAGLIHAEKHKRYAKVLIKNIVGG